MIGMTGSFTYGVVSATGGRTGREVVGYVVGGEGGEMIGGFGVTGIRVHLMKGSPVNPWRQLQMGL